MPDREAIRSNAQYLRNVRPIDPEEIHEYVDGQPHPAVVRRVLREEAFELGLVERADGTFVPVDDEPAPPPSLPVESFPDAYADRLEDLLVESFGVDWAAGESGDSLRERIRKLKTAYHRGWDVAYDDETAALAYAIYHLPDYYAAIQYVLAELAEQELLDRQLRVLDVGAGVGGPALGVVDAMPDDALIEYHAVEPGAGAAVFEGLLAEPGGNVDVHLHRTTAEALVGQRNSGDGMADAEGEDGTADDESGEAAPDLRDEPFDLVVFANVLSELEEPSATAAAYAGLVDDDGAMILLSPADRSTARTLREVERALVDDPTSAGGRDGGGSAGNVGPPLTVFSPTVRLWPDRSPGDEGWSFVARPDLSVPPFQRRLDEAAGSEGEFVNVDVQYAYATLRRDGRRRIEFTPERSRWAPLGESERNVAERIDCVAVKLSGNLAEDGNPLYRVGDGSERMDHFAVLTRETSLNADLAAAAYGDLLTLESVLVLWNDDEGAYNLVVDDETIVDAAAAPIG